MTYVNSLNVYPSRVTIQTGHWYYDAWAEVCPLDAEVEWYSDNTGVASVNASSGHICANSPGTARIYARATDCSGVSDYLTVTVSNTVCVSTVELNRASISLEKGDSIALTATVYPTNATNPAIHWRSTNTSVATVDGGVVTAKARGNAYIYAEAMDGSGAAANCYVSVTEDILVTSVTVSPVRKTMTAGKSDLLYATVCPPDATNDSVEWSSSDPCVATVNPDSGFVVAQNAGEATITATAQDGSGAYGECFLTVGPPIPVEGVTVSPASLTMNVGDTVELKATVCPFDATDTYVTWRSSNENVATVGFYSGLISAKMAGTVTITATTIDGGFTASCTVTVIDSTTEDEPDTEDIPNNTDYRNYQILTGNQLQLLNSNKPFYQNAANTYGIP